MSSAIATVVYCLAILMLFKLDSYPANRRSRALWIPVAWLLINGSRPLTLWFQPSTRSVQSLEEGSPLDRNVYLVILAAGLVVLWGRRTTVARLLSANAALPLFIFYCALSITWSDDPFVSFKRWVKLVGDVAMVLIILTDPDRWSAMKRVLARVAFFLVPLSILLIKYYPELARYYDPWSGRQMVSGVAVDKNMLGMSCLVFGFGVFCQFSTLLRENKSRVRTRRLVAQGCVLAMVLWLFNSADSMTSLSCFIMASILFTVTSLVKAARKPAMVHLLVIVLVGISFSTLFLHIGGDALKTMGRNPTLTGRTEIWAGLLKFSGNPLIGTGFDSFWLGGRLQRIWAAGGQLEGINEAHNGYLETFLNLGWVGVILLVILIATGYRNIVVALRREPDIGRLRLAFFVVAVVYNFTEAAFRTTCSVWIAFLLAVTAVPSVPILQRSRPLDASNLPAAESELEVGSSYQRG